MGVPLDCLKVKKMQLSLIVACDRKNGIGKDGKMPWHLPADLKYFKSVTMGKPMVMGRKTFQSIGKALPGRRNIVLTRDSAFQAEGCEVIHDAASLELLCSQEPEVMVIGGAEIYRLFFEQASRLYLTEIDAESIADTHFPTVDSTVWWEVSRVHHLADDKNRLNYAFVVLQREKADD